MRVNEEVILFGAFGNLVGVLSEPQAAGSTAVILLDAGLIHHVGPGRLHVRLAREFSAAGITSLRFDFSGVGDSPPRPDQMSALDIAAREPVEAIEMLAEKGYETFVLIGLCSGAVAGILAAALDQRIIGTIAVNVPSLSTDPNMDGERQAWLNRYLKRSLFSPRAWRNLLTGRVDYGRLFRTFIKGSGPVKAQAPAAVAPVAEVELPDIRGLVTDFSARGGRLMFLMSGEDASVDHVSVLLGQDVRRTPAHAEAETLILPDTDHMFTREADKKRMIDTVMTFVQERASETR